MQKRMLQLVFIFVASLFVTVGPISRATAQVPMQSRETKSKPISPPLSPYLNLMREDSGPLPSYQAFVVPRQTILQQQSSLFQVQKQLSTLNKQGQSAYSDPRIRQTGMGGRYQNFSHFYTPPIPNN